ncbi:MAG TPA: hypothetical protein PL029_09675 [Bacteroidia bacterium]|nr:hypothetical protein [Bacteroidia bacterium]
MTKQILKTALAGFLAGVLLFTMPFIIIKVLVFFLLVRAIFRLMGGGRHRSRWKYAYAHQFQNMSAEERHAFMQKYARGCGSGYNCDITPEGAENKDDQSGGTK